MNNAQRVLVVAATLIVAAMGVFPPWHMTVRGANFDRGYRPIWDSPGSYSNINVNVPRLLAQWLGVVIVAGGLFVVLRDAGASKPKDHETTDDTALRSQKLRGEQEPRESAAPGKAAPMSNGKPQSTPAQKATMVGVWLLVFFFIIVPIAIAIYKANA